MKKVVVVGAGTMGNGIAHVFAMNDFKVHLCDVSEQALDQAIQTIDKNLWRMVAKEKISESEQKETINNIKTFTDLKKACDGVDLAVEAATENESLKLKIFDLSLQNIFRTTIAFWTSWP